MNKKIVIITMAIIVLLIVGFAIRFATHNSNVDKNIDKTLDMNSSSVSEDKNNDAKILIAYFSRAGENYSVGNVEKGNTQIMAENISKLTGGTLYEIEPVNPYPIDYEETKKRASEESSTDARPKIKTVIDSFNDYDVIFIGYPIWSGNYPMIINTFMESYDFSNKTVIPFNTHEGSGSSGTYEKIKSKLSSATVLNGLAIRGKDAREEISQKTIESWLNNLNLLKEAE